MIAAPVAWRQRPATRSGPLWFSLRVGVAVAWGIVLILIWSAQWLSPAARAGATAILVGLWALSRSSRFPRVALIHWAIYATYFVFPVARVPGRQPPSFTSADITSVTAGHDTAIWMTLLWLAAWTIGVQSVRVRGNRSHDGPRPAAHDLDRTALIALTVGVAGTVVDALGGLSGSPWPATASAMLYFAVALVLSARHRVQPRVRAVVLIVTASATTLLVIGSTVLHPAALLAATFLLSRKAVGGGMLLLVFVAPLLLLPFQVVKSELRQRTTGPVEFSAETLRYAPEVALGSILSGPDRTATEEAMSRFDLLTLGAAVIERTPLFQPYESPSEYLTMPLRLVPRVLAPGRPTETSGQDFGHKYGFIHPDDYATSVNRPPPIEAYERGGLATVGIVALLAGVVWGLAQRATNSTDRVLAAAWTAFIFVPAFNAESSLFLILPGLVARAMVAVAVQSWNRRSSRPARLRSL